MKRLLIVVLVAAAIGCAEQKSIQYVDFTTGDQVMRESLFVDDTIPPDSIEALVGLVDRVSVRYGYTLTRKQAFTVANEALRLYKSGDCSLSQAVVTAVDVMTPGK